MLRDLRLKIKQILHKPQYTNFSHSLNTDSAVSMGQDSATQNQDPFEPNNPGINTTNLHLLSWNIKKNSPYRVQQHDNPQKTLRPNTNVDLSSSSQHCPHADQPTWWWGFKGIKSL